jgi:MAE_28990/MAE_18760-like HEPN
MVKVLKAHCFLIFYNMVEGSITEAIDEIFEAITKQNVCFKELIPAYQRLWLAYQTGLVKIAAENAKAKDPTKNKIGKSLPTVLGQLEYFKILTFTDKDENRYQNYRGYLKVVDSVDLSGNLDARKIRELAEKYAFSVPERCDDLLKIKNIRNQLAHGEIIFSEVSAISITELMEIKTNVLEYLEAILLNINEFIEKDGFKI